VTMKSMQINENKRLVCNIIVSFLILLIHCIVFRLKNVVHVKWVYEASFPMFIVQCWVKSINNKIPTEILEPDSLYLSLFEIFDAIS